MTPTAFYSYLTSNGASVLNEFLNDAHQNVILAEHPRYGEDGGVCTMFPEYEVAFRTDFYDTEDLTARGDYQPLLLDGELKFAYEVN